MTARRPDPSPNEPPGDAPLPRTAAGPDAGPGTAELALLRLSTAGSVDDGKSTLIGRLLCDTAAVHDDTLASARAESRRLNRGELDLALFTDGLKAEREQGITIDVAYRYFSTATRAYIIADTPGHESYTRNMATGASTADLAVIVVDARNGALTQSRRHAFIASLLGIPRVVVAVNKMDLVGWSQQVFEGVRAEFEAFAAELPTCERVFIPLSALRGDNVVGGSAHMPWYDGPSLLQHLEQVPAMAPAAQRDFRFAVQYVNRPDPDFRGYAGQIASGVVQAGDEVLVLPSMQRTTVRRIVTWPKDLARAQAPQSVTLCLADELDISRGDMLSHPSGRPSILRKFEADLVWMDAAPLRARHRYLLKHTTRTSPVAALTVRHRVDPVDLRREPATTLALNEIGRVQVELARPVIGDAYRRNRATGSFILIDPVSHATVAAGMIHTRQPSTLPDEAAGGGNLTPHDSGVGAETRERLLGQRATTLWLTGLSGSGKSTVAFGLERRLIAAGYLATVLDGDNLRSGLNRDLGFSPGDRAENIRRVGEVARLLNDAGLIVITAFVSPYRSDRRDAGEAIGAERFVEVFVDAPLAVCEGRDPKGLYRKARDGTLAEFTGVSAPYEIPEAPGIHLRTDDCAPAEAVERLFDWLQDQGRLRRPG